MEYLKITIETILNISRNISLILREPTKIQHGTSHGYYTNIVKIQHVWNMNIKHNTSWNILLETAIMI